VASSGNTTTTGTVPRVLETVHVAPRPLINVPSVPSAADDTDAEPKPKPEQKPTPPIRPSRPPGTVPHPISEPHDNKPGPEPRPHAELHCGVGGPPFGDAPRGDVPALGSTILG